MFRNTKGVGAMSDQESIRPLKLWQSFLFFLGPGLYGFLATTFLFPLLTGLGVSEENAYHTVHYSVFILLFVMIFAALRSEGRTLNRRTLRERMRYKRMDSIAWKWTIPFLLLYLILGFGLNTLALLVYERLGFWPSDADIPLTSIPLLLIGFVANIFSEELLWRGIILPRQELEHGKWAWLVNGVLWTLFHLSKWYAMPFMLLKQWMLPFVAQRTQNNTPAFLIHFVSNGLSIIMTIIALLSS